MRLKIKSLLLQAVMVSLVVAAILALPRHLAFTAVAENWAADSRATLFTDPAPPHPQVMVLTITEDTLAGFPYRFPVDRAFLAGLLNHLAGTGVKLVAFDILFDQPTDPVKDQAFRDAVLAFPAPVIVGWTDRETGLTERQAEFQTHYTQGIRTGFSNTFKDVSDSTIRRIFPGRATDQGYHPGFVPLIVQSLGLPAPPDHTPIHYRLGPEDGGPAIRTFPAHTVKVLPKAWFKDKIILVGADLPFEDRHRTPLAATFGRTAGTLPGVLVHAHAVAQLVDGIDPPRPNLAVEFLAALTLTLAAAWLGFSHWPLAVRLGLAVVSLGLFWSANALAYRWGAMALPLISPSLGFVVMLALSGYHSSQLRLAETRFIRDAFSRYVAPGLVSKLQENPDRLSLGGEKRDVTVLFSDVEGFTSMSESLDAALLVAVLNDYLDGMVSCVHRHGGMVDKFIGDAVMAIFGAPDLQADHAARAIACALEMQSFAAAFVQRQKDSGIGFGRTRIGLHSGPAVVGNVGGSKRFDYTAIGDTVNTASRLEGVNKYFGTGICVSASTAESSGLTLRPIGRIVVKGRTEALPTFTPIAEGEDKLASAYGAVYSLMAAGDPLTLPALADLASRFPQDPLIQFHLKRLDGHDITDLIIMKDK